MTTTMTFGDVFVFWAGTIAFALTVVFTALLLFWGVVLIARIVKKLTDPVPRPKPLGGKRPNGHAPVEQYRKPGAYQDQVESDAWQPPHRGRVRY